MGTIAELLNKQTKPEEPEQPKLSIAQMLDKNKPKRLVIQDVRAKIQDGKAPSRMDMESLGVSMNRKQRKGFAETVRKSTYKGPGIDIWGPQDVITSQDPAIAKSFQDLSRVIPEAPKAIAAGTERALGAVGTALQFKGEQMQDPVHRLLMKAAPGPAIIQFISDKFGLPEKLKKSGKYIAEYWDEQASKGWEAPDPELMEQKWNRPLQYGARVTFESAPTFAAAIGAGYATGNPALGLTILGAFEKMNSYAAQRKKGASFQKANMISNLSGAWEL